MQCEQGPQWIQAGITSYGVPCALAGFPEVYARVSEFQEWIMDQVGGANVGFVTFTSSGTDPDNDFVCRSNTNSTGNSTMVDSGASGSTGQIIFVTILTMFQLLCLVF